MARPLCLIKVIGYLLPVLRLDFSDDSELFDDFSELPLPDDLLPDLTSELPDRCPVLFETDWPEDELLPVLSEDLLSWLLVADSRGALLSDGAVVVERLVVVVVELCRVVPDGLLLVSVFTVDSLLEPDEVDLLTSLPDDASLEPDDLVPDVVVSLLLVVLVDCLTAPPVEVLLPADELRTLVAEPPLAERVR